MSLDPSVMTTRRTTPIPVGILAAVGVAFLAIPLVGLLLRTPWSRLPELLTSPVANACTMTLPSAVASTGPVTTERRHASAVKRQSK